MTVMSFWPQRAVQSDPFQKWVAGMAFLHYEKEKRSSWLNDGFLNIPLPQISPARRTLLKAAWIEINQMLSPRELPLWPPFFLRFKYIYLCVFVYCMKDSHEKPGTQSHLDIAPSLLSLPFSWVGYVYFDIPGFLQWLFLYCWEKSIWWASGTHRLSQEDLQSLVSLALWYMYHLLLGRMPLALLFFQSSEFLFVVAIKNSRL